MPNYVQTLATMDLKAFNEILSRCHLVDLSFPSNATLTKPKNFKHVRVLKTLHSVVALYERLFNLKPHNPNAAAKTFPLVEYVTFEKKITYENFNTTVHILFTAITNALKLHSSHR